MATTRQMFKKKYVPNVAIALSLVFISLITCNMPSSRGFSYLLNDNSKVTLQLIPKTITNNEGQLENIYFFILKLKTSMNFDPISDGLGCPSNVDHRGYYTRLSIEFFDKDGMLLYKPDDYTTAFKPGWNLNCDEIYMEQPDSSWVWKGIIPKRHFVQDIKNVVTLKINPEIGDCTTSNSLKRE